MSNSSGMIAADWSDWFAAQPTTGQQAEFPDEPEVEFEPGSSQPRSRDEVPWIPIVGNAGRSYVATPVSQSSLNDPSIHNGLGASMTMPLSRTNPMLPLSAIPAKHPQKSRVSLVPQQQQVMQRSPASPSKADFALPFSNKERERLRKLAVENVALLEANYKTRMLLDEMTSRLQRMRGAAAERGQSKIALLTEIAET